MHVHKPGLPDGIFADQKSQIWYILRALRMEHLVIFYGKFVICITIW
jgi:hypothetical protein